MDYAQRPVTGARHERPERDAPSMTGWFVWKTNGCAERRARRRLTLALYLPRVRSCEVLEITPSRALLSLNQHQLDASDDSDQAYHREGRSRERR